MAYWNISIDCSAAGDRRRFADSALHNEIILASFNLERQTAVAGVIRLRSSISQ